MGIEVGSVIIYKKQFWLFAGYGKNENCEQTYRLHGLNGVVDEVPEDECTHLISPSEMRV